MDAAPLYSFPALMESLEPALAYVRAAALGTEPAVALRAETALEELITNSVLHGNAAQAPDAAVWLAVVAGPKSLTLRFEDAFPAFNPLSQIDAALHETARPIEERRAGGLGLLMVYRLADEFRYVCEKGHNCVELMFRSRRPD